MKELSELYNATFKKNRGKAKEGFIRPTLSEYFMTHKDFTEINKVINIDSFKLPATKYVNLPSVRVKSFYIKPDGTKIYMNGEGVDTILQYSFGVPWDISTIYYDSIYKGVSSQEEFVSSVFFKYSGEIMYIIGAMSDRVHQYTLSTPWDLSSAVYDNKRFGIADLTPAGISFSNDGYKMYAGAAYSDYIRQYSLSSAWDVSTATYDSVYLDIDDEETSLHNFVFNNEGDRIYLAGSASDSVHQYNLSIPWDISSASYITSFYTDLGLLSGIFLKPDGKNLYLSDLNANIIYQYNL